MRSGYAPPLYTEHTPEKDMRVDRRRTAPAIGGYRTKASTYKVAGLWWRDDRCD